MVGIQARDRHALEAMYLSYHSPLTQFLSRFIASPSSVDDVINETFVVVWNSAKSFRRESSIARWVFRIAYETALRSTKHRDTSSSLRRVVDPDEGTAGAACALESDNWLRQGLSRLSMEQCATLTLAYQMGFAIDEVADITQSSLGTANARMHQASDELRGSLQRRTSRRQRSTHG